jgi:hypothetical protein
MTRAPTTAAATALAGILAAGCLIAAPDAMARRGGGGGDDVRRAGVCTAQSTSKLKLSPEDGRLEVEFEVDENRVGRVWRVGIAVNGRTVVTRRAVTRGPSGSFEVRAVLSVPAGARIAAVGRRPATGEVCRASASR